jgi:hypothetical protein
MSTKIIPCNFADHEKLVLRGDFIALQGWWAAALECINSKEFVKKNGTPNVSAYALNAEKISKKNQKANGGKFHSFNTINQQVAACVKAILLGNDINEFDSINNVKDTYRNERVVKDVKPVRKSAESKAYEALYATKEFKALPAKTRKAIKLMHEGKAFSTVSL